MTAGSNLTFIIAEAGVNHNGDLDIARQLIKTAADAGADAVKFQTFKADKLLTKSAEKAEYQKKHSDADESQHELIRKLELTEHDHLELMECCRENSIAFLSSPFDLTSIELLHRLGLEIFKIPSGEIINLPYLEAIGRLQKKVILSTGMSDMKEIESALQILLLAGTSKENITVLHANTEYPTPVQDVNLNAMQTIRKAFQVRVGYSDHTRGIEISLAAVALGASMIEKHFTLNRDMKGPDHKASLEPMELEALVKGIRNIELALGSGRKVPSQSESKNITIVRKSIVASTNIVKGEVFSSENITAKRPGTGISPMRWNEIIGTKAWRDYNTDDLIRLD
ncbi:MAG: N-acetylneuraminate synthase [Bacteroidetes bacterium]|nr:N-acetylneuraminate synthase [Bacteroidota bacterium]